MIRQFIVSGVFQKPLLGVFCILAVIFLSPSTRPTAQDSNCNETSGAVERISYRSAIISTNMVYSVYTPPCYDTARPYPVLYLMHGSVSDDHQWPDELGLRQVLDERILAGTMPPVIAVFPFGNWIANENQFGEQSWENVFLGELLPDAEGRYAIDPDFRMIGGISRGGFWAYGIGLRHPEMFKAIGGHSAFFDRYHAPPNHNPLDLAQSVALEALPVLYLDRGASDYAAPGLDLMHERLNERDVPHAYVISEGEHNNAYWASQVGAYLEFYTQVMQSQQPATLVFATNTPTPEPITASTPEPSTGIELYLPVVAFPSIDMSMSSDALNAALAGELDEKLTVSQNTADALAAQGIDLHPETRLLDTDEAVQTVIWADRTRYGIIPFDLLNQRLRVLWVDEVNPLDALDAYPLAFPSDTPNFEPERLTTLLLTGVTAITRRAVPYIEENGVDWVTEAIEPYISLSDFVHTSNEVSFVEGCPDVEQPVLNAPGFSFCSAPEYFAILENIGLDIVELSGNHNNDYGFEAYRDTLAWYQERDILTVGGGETLDEARRPLTFAFEGGSVAWISCNWAGPTFAWVTENPDTPNPNPGAARCDETWLRTTLPALAAQFDVVIVTVQYWEFDQHVPTPQQRIDFGLLAQWGADVVIGTQAHFPQTYEFVEGMGGEEAFVHYGIGNLFFDQPWWATRRFTLDRLFIYGGEVKTVEIFPGIADDLIRPRPMTPEERENYLYVLMVQNGRF